ncbi:hypothetical protein N7G274_004342 [Stereocaulon virgatum]|uniref:C2H2-type domain-containing protein n=1 Tax=Stereocaulon virgatum TaxID=373712 RepID=A0ABR4AA56_9LECA
MDLQASAPTQSDRHLVSTRSLLPESSCTLKPALSFESTTTNTDDEEKTPSSIPTPAQELAITILKDVEEEKIIAWLTLLRSIEPGFQLRSGPGCLSSEQIAALNRLKDCQNGNVLAWLRYDLLADNVNVNKQLLERRSCGSSRSASRNSTGSFSRFSHRSSARSSLRSSISSFETPSPYNSATSYSSSRSSLGQASLIDLGGNEHTHWCTYGEHKNPITTCDGWKRHEKEHETVYVCMPRGPIEDWGLGPQCVFCGLRRPHPSHFQEHHLSSCLDQSTGPMKRSRKSNMVKHLASHGVSNDDASALAERWREMPNKKVLSCGFCVKLFTSLTDRLNHIDQEHWSHGQDMDQWRLNNVIRGLLLQTEVSNAWQYLLARHPTLHETDFNWELPAAKGLQLRLEIGEESGQDLALAAFQLRTNASAALRQGIMTSIGVCAEEQMDLDSHTDFQGVAHAALTTATSFMPNATFTQRSASIWRPPTVLPLNVVDNSRLDFGGSQFPQPNQTALFQSPFTIEDSSYGLSTQKTPFTDSSGYVSGQLLSSCKPIATQSLDSRLRPRNDLRDRDHSNVGNVSLIDQHIKTGEALSAFASADVGSYQSAPSSDQPNPFGGVFAQALPSVNGNTGSQLHYEFDTDSQEGKPLPAPPLPPQTLDHSLTIPMDSDFDSDCEIF